MIERELQIQALGARLSGTLCSPAEGQGFPVVLMIHGTGPLDRNENMPGQRLDVFNAIAHRLAESGIASLRYDKRGCGRSSGQYLQAGQADLVGDAVACIDHLAREGFGPRYLLGHSEGCLIAPRASVQRSEVAGLVLLCPVITPLETVLMQQAAQIEREIAARPGWSGTFYRALVKVLGRPTIRQRRMIERIKATHEPTIRLGLQPIGARSLRDLMQLDPRALFAEVQRPLLVIGGEKDLQCDPADVAAIAAICGQAETHVLRDLTHLLRRDDRPASLFGAAELVSKPIDPQVLELVAEWLAREAGVSERQDAQAR